MDVLSKGEFAAHIKVTPGRISQYISAGIIGPDALVGEGRGARINVSKAIEQIRKRRHVGQALGNGLLTHLAGGDTPAARVPGQPAGIAVNGNPVGADPDDVARMMPLKREDPAELIQLERLESERRKNRMAAVDEARSLGKLVEADAIEREVGKAAQATVNAFTGMAPDLANAIAAKFEVSQRDVLHLIRQVMNEKRAAIAAQMKVEATGMPEAREIVVE